MESNPTEFTTGSLKAFDCVREAWELIKSDYWMLFGITIVGALIGGVSMYVLIGAMICGIFYCYLKKIDGGKPTFDDLWMGFKYFGPSLLVTVVIFVPVIFFCVLMFVTIYLPIITAAAMGQHADGNVVLGSFLVGVTIDVVVGLVMVCLHSLLIFSFPLIVDRGLSSWDAMRLSARAVLKNVGGVGGLLVVNFLMVLAGEFMCGIGMYFVMPLLMATHLVAYRRVFPRLSGRSFDPPPPSAYPNFA